MIEVHKHSVIDLTKNPNQKSYFDEVMAAVAGTSDKRIFNYGGAIRGGKTYVSLFILMVLCKMYPGSRWHVVREDMPALKGTSITSLEKLIGGSLNWHWRRDSSDYYVEYVNKSRIYFKGENFSQDPHLNDFLGLETNGIMMEQLEELTEKGFNIILSRTGSWYIDPMPPGLILTTFNPTQSWVKDRIHVPFLKGTLPEKWHYQPALPKDNPFVTEDQWSNWQMMDDRYQKQFIDGDWTNFDDTDNRWAWAFSRAKVQNWKPVADPQFDLILSWDFNRNPMACTVAQIPDYKKIMIPKVYKLANMGCDGICERIKVEFPNFLYIITGDYSGDTDTTLFEEHVSNYTIIQQKLNLSDQQIQIMPNPKMVKNRTLVNTILQHMPHEIHEDDAKQLIWDFENVKAMGDGTIDKGAGTADRKDPAKQADVLDTYRYLVNRFLGDYVHIPMS